MKKIGKTVWSIILTCSLLLNATVSYAQGVYSDTVTVADSFFDQTNNELHTTDFTSEKSEDLEMVPGEILVVYEGTEEPTRLLDSLVKEELLDVPVQSMEIIAEDIGQEERDFVVLEVEGDNQIQDVIEQLNQQEGIIAQPNYIYHTFDDHEYDDKEDDNVFAKTDDPFAEMQYYLNDYNENGKDSGAGVYQAWNTAKVDKSVTVAVLDTGCDTEHLDLVANIDIEHMRDVYNGTSAMVDGRGHGTHVCGIVGAVADNGIGIAGASYNAAILPIKIFDDTGQQSSTKYIIKAYEYLGELIETGEVKDLRVINMSLGTYDLTMGTDYALEQIISDFREDYQVLTVASGGNGKGGEPLTDFCAPSDFDCVLSVTCLDKNGGNTYWSDYNMYKDISAPGQSIYSTYPNSSYETLSGTSMAAPLVSGIAALLFAAAPGAAPDDVVDAIKSTAHSMEGKANDRGSATGSAGAIDAAAAIEKLMADFTESDSKEEDPKQEDPDVEELTFIDEPIAANSLVYNGTLQTGVPQGEGYKLTGQASAIHAGNYTVYAELEPGYQWRGDNSNTGGIREIKWSIAKKSALIAADDASKTYGENDPDLTATVAGVIEGEQLNYLVERETGEDAGIYLIRIVPGNNPNYSLVTTSAIFTILAAPESPEDTLPNVNETYRVGKLIYRVTASIESVRKVSVVSPVNKTYKKLTIPSTVKLNDYVYKVTQIDNKAFYNNKKLTRVEIGTNVGTIGKRAFYGCSMLKKIDIKSNKINKIGTKAFAKISKKAKIYVPKKKRKTYQAMLQKAKIPKGVPIIKR